MSPRLVTDSREASLRAVFDNEHAAMVRLAFLVTGNASEAEEVVQDAFAELWARWDSVLNPGGYLRTAVVNRARRVRHRGAHRTALYRKVVVEQPAHREPGDFDHILDALDQLNDRQRCALILAYWLDLGSKEIAATLECSQGTAKSLVHRGLKKLREELNDV